MHSRTECGRLSVLLGAGVGRTAMMDEINYRRLTALPKQRCEACGATAYKDPDQVFRCVVCDHQRYEVCLDCGHLRGWCQCPPPEPIPKKKRVRASPRAKK